MVFGLLSEASDVVITEECVVLLRRTKDVLVVIMIVHAIVVAVEVSSVGIKLVGIKSAGIRSVGTIVKGM